MGKGRYGCNRNPRLSATVSSTYWLPLTSMSSLERSVTTASCRIPTLFQLGSRYTGGPRHTRVGCVTGLVMHQPPVNKGDKGIAGE
jgi:hypothetical protein